MSARSEQRDKGRAEPQMNGFGDGLAKAFELVVTPAIFAAIGYGLDRIFDTKPIFVISLALFGIIGVFFREYLSYSRAMAVHDKNAIWGKR